LACASSPVGTAEPLRPFQLSIRDQKPGPNRVFGSADRIGSNPVQPGQTPAPPTPHKSSEIHSGTPSGSNHRSNAFRRCHSAQPPANFWQPSALCGTAPGYLCRRDNHRQSSAGKLSRRGNLFSLSPGERASVKPFITGDFVRSNASKLR
jgi:hypothetical protein